jgi:tripartite-type tricarboxylate transporter receptor subunit TctC
MTMIRLFVAAFLLFPLVAPAQNYPAKPIRMVVPFAAGGAADTVARPVGIQLAESLGQPVVVENRGGGGATIGADIVAKAAPDGYTLLMAVSPPQTTASFFIKNMPYDAIKDFTPISVIGTLSQAIVVHPSVPARNLKELIDYAKRNPANLSFATAGIGTAQHLGGLHLNKVAGIDLQHVSYKGGGQAIVDVLGGQVPIGILTLSNVTDHARAGKLRMIAMMEGQRAKGAPDVPTVAEAALPGFAMPDTWIGLFGPANLPTPIVNRLHQAVAKALESTDVRTRLESAGFELRNTSQQAFAEAVRNSYSMYQQIVSGAGIKPE